MGKVRGDHSFFGTDLLSHGSATKKYATQLLRPIPLLVK